MRPVKRYSGRLRTTRRALWGPAEGVLVRRGAVLEVTRVVVLDEEERLAPDAAGELAQAGALALAHDLVGVEVHDPVARRSVEGDVARGAEVAGPFGLDDLRAVGARDVHRGVRRAGVD